MHKNPYKMCNFSIGGGKIKGKKLKKIFVIVNKKS